MTFYLALFAAILTLLHAGIAVAKVIAAKTKSTKDDKIVAMIEKLVGVLDALALKLK